MTRSRVSALLDEGPKPAVPETFALGEGVAVRSEGVGLHWLAQAFGMDHRKVKARMHGVKPIGMHSTPTGDRPVYSLREAAGYLSPNPTMIANVLKNLGPSDLPTKLQKDIWDARLKELAWRERAGELWRTEDVLEVFGEVFMTIKGQVSGWVDQVGESANLDEAQRERLRTLTEVLQKDLHKRLLDMPKKRRTPSVAEIESDVEDADDGV